MVVTCFIAMVGLLAAYICFGILKSDANGKYEGYSVGGAIAGAIVSWSVLATIFLKLRKSTSDEEELQNKRDLALEEFRENNRLTAEQRKNELDQLRKQVVELQSKLIRGAPKPNGYTIEVAERESIVLARPAHWAPKGGTIFELELPEFNENTSGAAAQKVAAQNDIFPATFRCYFLPIEDANNTPLGRDKYYHAELTNLKNASDGDNPFVASYSTEKIRLGGEPTSIESLKVIARQYLQIRVGPSADTGAVIRTWRMISRDEFAGRIWEIIPPVVNVGQPRVIAIRGSNLRKNAICYLGERPLESSTVWVNNIGGYELLARLPEEAVRTPGQFRISVMNPDTDGFRSVPFPLTVIDNGSVKSNFPLEMPLSGEKIMEPHAAATSPQPTGKIPETDTTVLKAAPAEPPKEQFFYQQVSRMRVLCYHEQLKKIYFFDFWDDVGDFVTSSDEFNQIIASTRFLC